MFNILLLSLTFTFFPYTTLFRSRFVLFVDDVVNQPFRSAARRSHKFQADKHVVGTVGGQMSLQQLAEQFSRSEAGDRKSTRLKSSYLVISYAGFCMKKKNYNFIS